MLMAQMFFLVHVIMHNLYFKAAKHEGNETEHMLLTCLRLVALKSLFKYYSNVTISVFFFFLKKNLHVDMVMRLINVGTKPCFP